MTTPNNGLVLGEHGYRPGLAVTGLYRGERREGRFWELLTCGVDSRPVGPMLAGCRLERPLPTSSVRSDRNRVQVSAHKPER
jgi:hypothetical protein